MSAYTQDSIALGVIAQGRRQGVDDLAIVCAISCALVESNLTMYANRLDPDSLKYPHDAVSTDQNSSGIYQQRAPWWDDPATNDNGGSADRMDVAISTKLFLNQLLKQRNPDYHANPGVAIANTQQPAQQYRGRYAQRMDEAWSWFNRLAGVPAPPANTPTPILAARPDFQELDFMTGGGRSSRSRQPINFFLHTEEGNSDAEQLARYCDGSHDVSYHYTLRDRKLCDVVDTDFYSWSVLSANVFSINLCFAGSRAAMSREEWLVREDDIEIAAFIAVQDARKYGFSTEVIAPPYHQAPGISDHKYVTECLGIGTHHDVGDQFPWDIFRTHVNRYATGEIDDMAQVPQDQWDRVYRELTQSLPSRSIYRTPGEGLVDTMAGFVLNTDAMAHQELIERLAVTYGDPDAVKRITAVASGEGADPKDAWAVDHAKAVIERIPAEYRDNWKDA